MGDADRDEVPPGSGRARDLVGRRRQRKARDTGRVHHLGAAPPVMPVLREDGAETATRTAAVQLASRTRWELDQLLADLGAEMAAAAAALDFERARRLRDERAKVQAELDRRDAIPRSVPGKPCASGHEGALGDDEINDQTHPDRTMNVPPGPSQDLDV